MNGANLTDSVTDLAATDLSTHVTVVDPQDPAFCLQVRRATNARVCVGKAGTGLRTDTVLRYLADHAAANDAVWADVDEEPFEAAGFLRLGTLARDKAEYLKRPDLGRQLDPESRDRLRDAGSRGAQVQLVVADGLSAHAVERNLPDLLPVLEEGFALNGWTTGRPIYVRRGRVGVMDRIGMELASEVVVLLVGERPGLATSESLSCYMAWRPGVDKPESQRTVISNIHRAGTPPVEAGAQIVHLVEILLREKKSGSELKL